MLSDLEGTSPKRIHIAGPDAPYTQPFQVPNTVPAYLQSTYSTYRLIASVTVSQAHFQSIKSAQHLNLDLNPSAPALVQPDPSVSKVPFPIDDKPCRSYYSTKKAPVRDLPQGLLPYLGTTYVLQRSFATRSLRGFRKQQRAGLFFFFWSVLASVSVCLSVTQKHHFPNLLLPTTRQPPPRDIISAVSLFSSHSLFSSSSLPWEILEEKEKKRDSLSDTPSSA